MRNPTTRLVALLAALLLLLAACGGAETADETATEVDEATTEPLATEPATELTEATEDMATEPTSDLTEATEG